MSGAGVVHYQLLHRPRNVPTALGPAPLVTSITSIISVMCEVHLVKVQCVTVKLLTLCHNK